ncbi:MAG: hypothetical protein P4L22_03200 [Candidatus Babeliales bacterium]|nr:hypothetical protein [Candidatus Babeliales bacterium]
MKLYKKVALSIALIASASSYASETNPTLLRIDGKAVLTQCDFDNLIEEITDANEQAKLMLQLIPDFREQFFNAKMQAIIISEWAKRNGIRNTPEYKKKENRMMEAIKESLDSEEFIKRYSVVEPSDEDALEYYEKNKDEEKYATFEEAKPTIKKTLKNKIITEMINAEIPQFKAEYNVVENNQYFENLRKIS